MSDVVERAKAALADYEVAKGSRVAVAPGRSYRLLAELVAEVERLRPKVVETVEELDALPIGAVIMPLGGSDIGDNYVNWADHHLAALYGHWYRSGYEVPCPSDEVDLPARVLYTPTDSLEEA
ncbi:hypothetical protein PBI_CHE8_87 [Mycobacterium phage Che8]|uniref:Uncharacterized protein n=1 Tax=Mycobacterium virus Che8 TaxID=205868 RepID=Q855C3_9CAUD|nr:hypothetical protein PBI_CHE8_87 [Mycobacterium phage Che8]AAN12485.1 hypothetical protein PBI_CHE8_87 [Mycobacterium phage Che8]